MLAELTSSATPVSIGLALGGLLVLRAVMARLVGTVGRALLITLVTGLRLLILCATFVGFYTMASSLWQHGFPHLSTGTSVIGKFVAERMWGLGLLAAAAVLAIFLLRRNRGVQARTQQDVDLLSHSLNRLEQGDYTQRLPESIGAQHFPLGAVFNRMTDTFTGYINQLSHNDESRKEFVAHVSHDLLKPVASIRAYAETIAAKRARLDDKDLDAYLDVIRKNTESLDRLVTSLLELSTLEGATYRLEAQSFSLSDLCSDLFARFTRQADEKKIALRVSGERQLPAVEGDPRLIERVLLNLIDNALKYTPQHGSVSLEFCVHDGRVRVGVRDTGIGMSANEVANAGSPLYRARKLGSNDPGGNGLGMAISRRILALHHSELAIQSVPEQGTCASFTLRIGAR